jgi:hypothetical protein
MQTIEQWKEEKDRILQAAKKRPAMWLGPKGREYLNAIQDALGLVWIAKVFRQAQQATVFLSPHQLVIRCETGPILRSIQKILSWQGKEILTSEWSKELSEHLGPDTFRNHRKGWRFYHFCKTGVRISRLDILAPFASRFYIGIRTKEGFWAQTFTEGTPDTPPLLISQPSSVGLLLGAVLTDEWFKLPLVEEEVRNSLYLSHDTSHFRKVPPGSGQGGSEWTYVIRKRKLFFPNTEVNWRQSDSLIAASPDSTKEINRWL